MKDKALDPNSIRTKILKIHSKTLSKPLAELKLYYSIKEETKVNETITDQSL